jgi:hypothetical protein
MAKKEKSAREKANVGILSWRASDEPHATKSLTKPFRKPSTEQESRQPVETQAPLVESIFRCDLRPSPAQKTVLDSLFSGPVLLKALLSKAAQRPQTSQETSMFLLEHHEELQPYLFAGNRSESVDLLKKLIIQWAARVPSLIELQFSGDCSVSASNQVFLPIPRLGTVAIQNESRMIDARHRSHYKPAFALVHSTLGYLIEIVFVRRDSRPPPTASVFEPQKLAQKAAPRAQLASERVGFDNFLMLFDNAVNQSLMNELRISRRFATPDFAALEGKEVPGGLPSLGKRR